MLKQTISAPSSTPPLSPGTKSAYGFGAVAFGIKDQGFGFFLLIFYSQVIGLDPLLVGLATSIALLIDAISDPFVGYLSDNYKSSWGRRHPFMYVSAVPAALSYFFLWAPPVEASATFLFGYLLLFAVLVRTFITLYETPSAALAPELTTNYEARSGILSYRYFFGWTSGNAMSLLMFVAIFPAFASPQSSGQFSAEAYKIYGAIAATLIFISIVVSSLGTHRRAAQFQNATTQAKISPRDLLSAAFALFHHASFRALIIASMFGAVAAGVSSSLALYFLNFFWGFSETQSGLIMVGIFFAAGLGAWLASALTRRFGKRRGAMMAGALAIFGTTGPITLRLLGILPENGTEFVFYYVLIATIIDIAVIICFQIIAASMMADLSEQLELQSQRRSEGLLFSSITFVRKSVGSLGILIGSSILFLAGIPAGVEGDAIEPASTQKMGAIYLPIMFILWSAMIFVVSHYRVSRDDHLAAISQLESTRRAQEESD